MRLPLFAALTLLLTARLQAAVISTVPVGDVGNTSDSTGFGAVAYDYRIGTTEVTNAQYAEFLNAKAGSDPLALYNANMSADPRAGITRTGSDGSYAYVVKANMGNKPVNYVSWYDSIRFANWLHNGQGNGNTETGAYALLGGTPTPINADSITRNPAATWFLPNQNEWYKAAYYQPAAQGGDVDDYWLYPTASNATPIVANANGVGDISNPGANVANYFNGADWNMVNGNVTTVGSAGLLSESFYGTADQGGNVFEWNEALIEDSFRVIRGGAWNINANSQQSPSYYFYNPPEAINYIGFRVATIAIPEPSTYALAIVGALALLAFRRRTR